MEHEPLKYISEPEREVLLLPPKKRHGLIKAILLGVVPLALILVFYFLFMSAPSKFPEDTVYAVMRGDTASGTAIKLAEKDIVRSPLVFKILMRVFGGTKGLIAGDYYLRNSEGAIGVAWRFSHGTYAISDITVTIPEGWNSREIAAFFAKSGKFVHFDEKEFRAMAAPYEGYLFPDTYRFLPDATAEVVFKTMTDTYKRRIQTLADEIAAFKRPISDIIKMASIIEEEARTEESRRIIAGILWKRFDEGLLLQVDAAFALVNGKTASKDLTLDDLKIDSPYNTYVYKGLPPTPISNPGLDSIRATISPVTTPYYFYLTDNDGVMRYGVNHDQHVANKARYLR
ncbi:MAG: endolytic transglycosylase MltG [bacterium]|nr:endolytic transglycosylase MltG [bacterium]